jgi:DNA-binding response OmpR family regulator
MPLSSLILSRDSQEVSVFECILGSLRIDVKVETDPSLAWIRLSKSKVDAVIVDCDLPGAEKFLQDLQVLAGRGSNPVIIVSGAKDRSRLESIGADFVAQKPVSVEQAVHTLSAARNLILKGRLRYYRQDLDTPVSITNTKSQINANLLNLSQSGIRVRLQQPHALRGNVGIHFLLPGTELPLDAQGKVAWADTRGNAGIRLMAMSEPTKRDLRLWLERQYFQTCGD